MGELYSIVDERVTLDEEVIAYVVPAEHCVKCSELAKLEDEGEMMHACDTCNEYVCCGHSACCSANMGYYDDKSVEMYREDHYFRNC